MFEIIFKLFGFLEKLHYIIKFLPFFENIPNIAGNYAVKYDNIGNPDAETRIVKQFYKWVRGETIPHDTHKKYYFKGNISQTRLVAYKFWPSDPNVHDFGVGFLKINDLTDGAEGYSIDISDETGKPYARKVFFIKV